MLGRRILPRRLPLLPASEVPDRLEVNVEVFGCRAQRAADHGAFLAREPLQCEAHVFRQLSAAGTAKSRPDRLGVVAARASRLARQTRHLFIG